MPRHSLRLFTLSALLFAAAALTGCGREAARLGPASNSRTGITINGAGATFPAPIYSKWADEYYRLKGFKINYSAIGSGGGVQQIKAGTVDFGASDAPVMPDELKASGLLQFPMVIGGVVPVVNLKGISPGEVRLTPQILAAIYLGGVSKWNDPALVKTNPGVALPATTITPVSRADGSGTSFIFTNYLDKVSPEWHSKVGFGKVVKWPAPGIVRGKGNDGVAAYVKRIDGAIGYVEYAYAVQGRMSYVKLQNRAGRYIDPSVGSFQAAAANADWKNAPGFYMLLTDQGGEKSWPITGASYIIVQKNMADSSSARPMLEFFDWCYTRGAKAALDLDYVAVPREVVKLIKDKWKSELTVNGLPAGK